MNSTRIWLWTVVGSFALIGCYVPPTHDNTGDGGGSPPVFIPGNGSGDGDGDGDGVGDGDGDGDGQASPTCRQPCTYDTDCTGTEACLSTSDGLICLPFECTDCFEVGASCSSNASTCEFLECGTPDPDYSDTCQEPCADASDCNVGEDCLYSSNGWICLPPQCQSCWDDGLLCNPNQVTCDFISCL
jgi:hypothetical protein